MLAQACSSVGTSDLHFSTLPDPVAVREILVGGRIAPSPLPTFGGRPDVGKGRGEGSGSAVARDAYRADDDPSFGLMLSRRCCAFG